MPILSALQPIQIRNLARPAIICIATIAIVVALFWSTVTSIVGIWSASETFTHGYFVLPVFFWLVWRQRDALDRLQIDPDYLALLPLTGAGALWLLCKLAGIQVGEHLAFVLILIFSLWCALGRNIADVIKFPLAFLVFLAPVGEELVPYLMEITADMTVWAIRQTNIPIYREGLFFSLPSGNWSVVEACSGIRYLISSTVLGALYAYLSFCSLRLRVAFMGIALAVPILANSMRAFIIVMLGHFSGNEIATGVDHLVYGWLFFGIVMFALFSIGGWLRKFDVLPLSDAPTSLSSEEVKDGSPANQRKLTSTTSSNDSGNKQIRGIFPGLIAASVFSAVWPLWFATANINNSSITPNTLAATFLPAGKIIDESVEPLVSTVSSWQPRNHGHDVRVESHYIFEGAQNQKLPPVRTIAFVYLEQQQGKEMISSRNTLVATRDDPWRLIQSANIAVEFERSSENNVDGLNTETITVKESVLKSSVQQLKVWQWYRIGSTLTSSVLVAKFVEVRNKLFLRDTVSATYILAADATHAESFKVLSDTMTMILEEATF